MLAPVERRILRASPGAWRWLGWAVHNAETGHLERWPAEAFGPIPGLTDAEVR